MIEDVIKNFLESKLTVPVLMEIPKSPASQFVVIEKTGGGQENLISSAILTIQSYGPSLYEAAVLNEQVKHWMMDGLEGAITLDTIAHMALDGDYNYTDTTSKRYRYQAVFAINHY